MSKPDNPGQAFLAELERDAHRYAEEAEEAWVDQEFFARADDEDLRHETANTGQLLEIAEDDGDAEKVATLARSYERHLAEQRRRAAATQPPGRGDVPSSFQVIMETMPRSRTADTWDEPTHAADNLPPAALPYVPRNAESADLQAAAEHRRRAAVTQPPEPPIGTVLETRGVVDDDLYRIERTADGWQQQYRDGEDEYGRRLHPTTISWRAAWSAWGPPNGAEPFREVAPDEAPLPALPSESASDIGPDAFSGRFDTPPAAEPYVPSQATTGHNIRTTWRVDGVRWLGPGRSDTPTEQRPSRAVTTTASSSGGAMATIGEARAGVMAGKEVGEQVLAGLTQQHASLEEVQNGLRHATTESNQAEAEQANAQLAEAMTKIEEAKQLIASALQEFEGVAQRL